LVANSDEFLYYDDLIRAAKKTPADRSKAAKAPPRKTAPPKAEAPASPSKTAVKAEPTKDDTPKKAVGKSEQARMDEAQDRVLEIFDSIEQDYDVVWGSMLKQAIRRVYPSFNEGYYGYDGFSDLLEDIEEQ